MLRALKGPIEQLAACGREIVDAGLKDTGRDGIGPGLAERVPEFCGACFAGFDQRENLVAGQAVFAGASRHFGAERREIREGLWHRETLAVGFVDAGADLLGSMLAFGQEALREFPKKGLKGPVRAVIARGGLLARPMMQSVATTTTDPVTSSPFSQARRASLVVSKWYTISLMRPFILEGLNLKTIAVQGLIVPHRDMSRMGTRTSTALARECCSAACGAVVGGTRQPCADGSLLPLELCRKCSDFVAAALAPLCQGRLPGGFIAFAPCAVAAVRCRGADGAAGGLAEPPFQLLETLFCSVARGDHSLVFM